MKHFSRLWILTLLFIGLSGLLSPTQAGPQQRIDLLQVKGTINPVVKSYIDRGLSEAEEAGAVLVVITLDTPGGLLDTTREIVQRMIAARVPIAVYVSPSGARAASAGVFITMAAHVAAMAPGTNIGAAHPVGGQGETITGTLGIKITNDAIAQIQGIAEQRGRNAEWAKAAVAESVSVVASEALALKVVDLVATDLGDLLAQIDGREVTLPTGKVVLKTAGVPIHPVPMSALESFLNVLSDPNIAYILFIIGINALLFELSNPGAILPGVVGVICLVLGLYTLGTLPIDYAGIALTVFAFILFIIDIKAPTHGLLTIGGVISLILGGVLLTNTSPEYFKISWSVIAGVTVPTALFFAFVVGKAVQSQRRPATTGREGLLNARGRSRTPLNPHGTVLVQGELWEAIAEDAPIEAGADIQVTAIQGFQLRVRRAKS